MKLFYETLINVGLWWCFFRGWGGLNCCQIGWVDGVSDGKLYSGAICFEGYCVSGLFCARVFRHACWSIFTWKVPTSCGRRSPGGKKRRRPATSIATMLFKKIKTISDKSFRKVNQEVDIQSALSQGSYCWKWCLIQVYIHQHEKMYNNYTQIIVLDIKISPVLHCSASWFILGNN